MRAVRFAFAAILLFLSAGLTAQTSQGRVLGTVRDPGGAVIPHAQVVLTNTASHVQRSQIADGAGEYIFSNVEPGPYQLEISVQGFERYQHSAFRVEVARDIRLDATLKLGAMTETVVVTEQAPVLNTTNDVLGTTFSNTAITELPLLGRDYQNLAVLQPGIQREPGGGFLSITANGNRPEDNNFIVDGLDDNDAYYGSQVINAEGVEGTPATHLPVDALQEFNVQSSPEAEYGDKPGAIINVGIKSGTDTIHGSAYYFHRNAALDARNYFNPAPDSISAVLLHQFGGSVGGPIVKGKLFYFVNYEGVRGKFGNPVEVDSPLTVSVGDPTISIPDAVAECMAANACSPLSLSLLKYFPTNTGTDDPNDITGLFTDFNNTNREDNGIGKLTYNLNARNSIYATYFHGNSLQTEEDVNVLQPQWLSQAQTDAQVYGGTWVYSANEHFSNAAHFAYNRFWQIVNQADHSVPPTAYGINTGVMNPVNFGFPEIRLSGFNRLGGNGSWPLYTTPDSTFIYADTANYLKGRHSWKFGVQVRVGSTDNLRDTYGKGLIRFRGTDDCAIATSDCSALEDFTQGIVSEGDVFVGDSRRVVSQTTYGAFVMDNWRLRPNVTFNWGLRYDVSLPIHEQHDLLGNFEPQLGGLVQVGKQISQPYHTDWNNFAPRMSLVWDTKGDGRTIVRVGGGVIYEVPHISVFIGQNGTEANGLGVIPTGAAGVTPGGGTIVATTYTWPEGDDGVNQFVTNNWLSGGPIFGNLSPNLISCVYNSSTFNPCPILGVDPNIRTPYVINWNLNLEQALWKDAGVTIAYVANKGVKLYSIRDINQNIAAYDTAGDEQSGRPLVNPALCGTQCFPYLSYVDILGNGDNSMFHSLQVTLKQQTFHGLFFVAGYTWAHSIDDATGNRAFAIQNSYNPAAERADADTDIRNRFTLAATYSLPEHQRMRALLNGWVMNSIITAQTGEPILFYDSSDDISGTGEYNDRWNLVGDPSDIQWSKSMPLPFYGGYGLNPVCDAYANQGVLTSPDQLNNYGCFQGPGYAILPPLPGTFGNMGRNVVRGPDYFDWDYSLIKQVHFSDRFYLELRGEIFNILNHPNFAGVDGDLSDGFSGSVGKAAYTPDIAASNPVIGSGGSRHIQLGAKIVF